VLGSWRDAAVRDGRVQGNTRWLDEYGFAYTRPAVVTARLERILVMSM
jgi:hypothetical protein